MCPRCLHTAITRLTICSLRSVSTITASAFAPAIETQDHARLARLSTTPLTFTLPGVLVGTWVGQQAAARVDTALFKQIVLAMCFGLGVKLALGA